MATDPTQTNSAIPTNYLQVPSYYVDGAIGAANARDVHHIVLGSVAFNTDMMATDPTYRPVVELSLTTQGVRDLIAYLENLPGVSDGEP